MTTSESSGAPEDDAAPKRRAPKRPQAAGGRSRLTKRIRRKYRDLARRANEYPVVLFLLTLALLNAMLNVRYPSDEPAFWYLVPSLDVIVLLGAIAVLALGSWKIAKPVRIAAVVVRVLLRLLRLGDGIQEHRRVDPTRNCHDQPLVARQQVLDGCLDRAHGPVAHDPETSRSCASALPA